MGDRGTLFGRSKEHILDFAMVIESASDGTIGQAASILTLK